MAVRSFKAEPMYGWRRGGGIRSDWLQANDARGVWDRDEADLEAHAETRSVAPSRQQSIELPDYALHGSEIHPPPLDREGVWSQPRAAGSRLEPPSRPQRPLRDAAGGGFSLPRPCPVRSLGP